MSIELTNIALQGLERSQQKVERAARRIAADSSGASASPATAPVDEPSLAESVVDLIEAAQLYQANLNLVKTGNEMTKRTLDILA